MVEERMAVHVAPLFRFSPALDADQRSSVRRALELIQQYLSACRAEDSYCVVLADLAYLRPFLCAHGEHRSFLRELAEAGRLDASVMGHQPNEGIAHAESLVRNLADGLSFHQGILKLKPDIYLSLGGSGHCLQLPQMLAKAGVEAIIWATDRTDLPAFCYLMAPDGSTVVLKPQQGDCLPADLNDLLSTAAERFSAQARLGLSHELLLPGGPMTPPPDWLAGRSEELAQLTPPIVLSTPKRYLTAVKLEAQLRRAALPLLGADLSAVAQVAAPSWELARASGLAENAILTAEKLAAIAYVAGARYPYRALDKAWRQALFAQSQAANAGGTWRLDLLACYHEALDLAKEVRTRSLAYVTSRVDARRPRRAPREGSAIVVFNTAGWSRSDVCHASVYWGGPLVAGFALVDDRGRRIPVEISKQAPSTDHPYAVITFLAADIPALGYRTYYLRPARTMPPVFEGREADAATIENEFLSLSAEASAGAGLTSLRDKSLGLELLNRDRGLGAAVVALTASGEMARLAVREVKVFPWQGPVSSYLFIRTLLADGGKLSQTISLYRGLPRVDLRTTITEPPRGGGALALHFPLTVKGGGAVLDSPFGAVVHGAPEATADMGGPGPGFRLARSWVDVGAVPSLFVASGAERKQALPLGPCAIITSGDTKHRAALRTLVKALLSRGVACTPYLDSDSPEQAPHPCALRISLGRENAYSKRLLQANPQAAACLSDALAEKEWASVLVPSPHLGDESQTIPVVIADTSAIQGVPRLIELLAEAVASDQWTIPEVCDCYRRGTPYGNYGVALAGAPPLVTRVDGDGSLVALLGADDVGERDAGPAACPPVPWSAARIAAGHCSHSLAPHAGDWREASVERMACEVSHPLMAMETHLQTGALPATFGLCAVDAPNLIITACRPPISKSGGPDQNRPEIIVRMYESHGKPTAARLIFGTSPEKAWLSDPREGRGSALTITTPRRGLLGGGEQAPSASLEVAANEIVTVGVRFDPLVAQQPAAEAEELGPTAEPCQPLFARWWDHNSGAAPLGNQPLTLWMRGELPVGKNTRFSLGLSNDSLDQEMAGKVDLLAPPEWTLIPRQVPYRIAPGSEAVYEIMIVVPPDAPPCFLRATTHDGTHTLQEVLAIGDIVPLYLSISKESDGFRVALQNPNPDYVEGQATLITPLPSWGEAVGSLALSQVSPRAHCFRIEANSSQTLRFSAPGKADGLWAVARVAWYGNVQYAYL